MYILYYQWYDTTEFVAVSKDEQLLLEKKQELWSWHRDGDYIIEKIDELVRGKPIE